MAVVDYKIFWPMWTWLGHFFDCGHKWIRFPPWLFPSVQFAHFRPIRELSVFRQYDNAIMYFSNVRLQFQLYRSKRGCAMLKFLRSNAPDHVPMDIRKPHIAAAEAVGEFFVVHAKLVQHRRVDVVNIYRVHHGGHAHFVGFAGVIPPRTPPPAIEIV